MSNNSNSNSNSNNDLSNIDKVVREAMEACKELHNVIVNQLMSHAKAIKELQQDIISLRAKIWRLENR